MSKINNNIILIGNLGTDPEVNETRNGKKVARLSLATHYKYRNSDDQLTSTTQWHRLVAWGPGAEYAEKYLRKGAMIGALGKITYREFTGKDGTERNFTEILVDEFKSFDRSGTDEALPF